ncbi:MAG: molecular chaperone DnaJ [Desulfobulbaceae bacterium]|uniref:Molecular chaperone DnaJ n=1 Tax=Candidatus Desulfobia pelagia TaxID=2841692 RepID=A0A8J6NDI6_9BACT|nr:molecular chaperone DnaJ [Candidatus Desulfobia pelagia]
MNGVAAEHELYRACQIIFGEELTVSREFLEYLQMSGVKSAFRKKAFEIHPDRATFQGSNQTGLDEKCFCSVREAYEALTCYVDARERGFRFSGLRPHLQTSSVRSPLRSHDVQNRNGRSASPSHGHKASPPGGDKRIFCRQRPSRIPLPRRPLLFGQYLYYAGHINWSDLADALIWQRRQCPKLGEIARRNGWLNTTQISTVLRHSTPGQPFGKTARYLGLLSESQLHTLLLRQKRMQKKFGEYFVEKKMFSVHQLAKLLVSFRRHNTQQFRPSFHGSRIK